MRTRVLVGWFAILSVLAMPLAAAQADAAARPSLVDNLIATLDDLVPFDLAAKGTAAGDGEGAAPQDASAAAKAAAVATGPIMVLSKGLLQLGLELIQGFFRGISEGAATFDTAMVTIVESPARSAAIAGAAAAAAGFFSFLWALSQRYGGFAAIPLFSRIAKEDILNNRLRNDIFELIQQNPGIHVSEISTRMGIAWGTCTHHLQKLRDERMVAIRTVGHQKCYFPNGGSYTPREMEVLSATKNATARRIAECLVETGPQSHGELAQRLSLSPALVSFHAAKLVAQGIIARERDGRRTIFRPLEANLHPTPRPMVHAV